MTREQKLPENTHNKTEYFNTLKLANQKKFSFHFREL